MKNWEEFFNTIKDKDYFKDLLNFLDKEREIYTIYPLKDDVFNAFKFTEINNIKVIIFGQDPYSHKDEAMGLAFSVNKGIKVPPSLRNIYKEIENEFHVEMNYKDGDLKYLAKQGVLLLNPILTVREGKPLSHDNELYKKLFLDIISMIEGIDSTIVYILLGKKSQKYKKYITNPNHFVLEANHPSPLSANIGGFFNTNIFIKTNEILVEHNISPIEWSNK